MGSRLWCKMLNKCKYKLTFQVCIICLVVEVPIICFHL